MRTFLKPILYLLAVHFLALIIFSVFRIILFFAFDGNIDDSTDIFKAFLMGVRFDNVISCYILIIPLAVIGFIASFNYYNKIIYKIVHIYFCLFYSIAFFVSSCNIPYFQQFFKNINSSIWNWLDEPSFVINMVTQESYYVIYVIIFIIFDIIFCFTLSKLKCYFINQNGSNGSRLIFYHYGVRLLVTIIFILLCVLGIRGRLGQKSPIRIGTAYFCNNPFLNQLGLNPTFVLMKTTIDMKKVEKGRLDIMNEEDAVENVSKYFGISDKNSIKCSPIVRFANGQKEGNRRNVILIMMESMASHFVKDKSLTPFINKLISKSLYFPNAYSAGIHTMNGVFGTLFSYPALLNQHPFKNGDILTYDNGLKFLKKNGYSTLYFSTHDEQFDNIGGYLFANNIEKIIAEKDYPFKEIRSNLGVTDEFMFKFSIPIITKEAEKGKPFFVSFLTASNHAPFIIPEHYKPRNENKRIQVIEFSDYSLSRFFDWASKESWFHNTLFVLLGDHGASNNDYDVSLAYHHIPLIIYDPQNEVGQVDSNIAGQIDVFPTIMGLLEMEYINNTFGIDLKKEKREMIFFSSDNAYCCLDSVNYFVHRMDGDESVYEYKQCSHLNCINEKRDRADKMRLYVQSMMQTAQYMLSNRKISVKNGKN